MITSNNFLTNLNDKSIWHLMKHSLSFDNAFRIALLFDEFKSTAYSYKEYFENNYQRFNIESSSYRVTAISQAYGLITKTDYYTKGGQYKNEMVTPVFSELRKYEIGSREYNIIKTEQILKFKIKSIIHVTDDLNDFEIFPLIYIYKVLKVLKYKYQILSVDLDLLYTYVFTSKKMSDYLISAIYIADKSPITSLLSEYQDLCRIPHLYQNLNVFDYEEKTNSLSINDIYETEFEYFINKFPNIENYLKSDDLYKNYLSNIINFNINLINVTVSNDNSEDDIYEDYYEDLNISVAEDVVEYDNPQNRQPININKISRSARDADPKIGRQVLKENNYKCVLDQRHQTFISNATQNQYMEAHHIIPMAKQLEIWNDFGINIDCPQNIVSLCPNCHNAVHKSITKQKRMLIEQLYYLKKQELSNVNLNFTINEILFMYKLK